jgi:hypothetical protein
MTMIIYFQFGDKRQGHQSRFEQEKEETLLFLGQ